MNLHVNQLEDTVARRIVMRRETWEQLVLLAEALQETRHVDVEPADVATIALEAGLEEVLRGQRGGSEPAPVKAAAASSTHARAARPSASGSTSRSGSGSQRRKTRPLVLSEEEQGELDALLTDVASARARQRTIALWLGLRRRKIKVDALRDLCTRYDAYNVANFAQNMKKDGLYFEEVRREGKRSGWKLTRVGQKEIKQVAEALLVGV